MHGMCLYNHWLCLYAQKYWLFKSIQLSSWAPLPRLYNYPPPMFTTNRSRCYKHLLLSTYPSILQEPAILGFAGVWVHPLEGNSHYWWLQLTPQIYNLPPQIILTYLHSFSLSLTMALHRFIYLMFSLHMFSPKTGHLISHRGFQCLCESKNGFTRWPTLWACCELSVSLQLTP